MAYFLDMVAEASRLCGVVAQSRRQTGKKGRKSAISALSVAP